MPRLQRKSSKLVNEGGRWQEEQNMTIIYHYSLGHESYFWLVITQKKFPWKINVNKIKVSDKKYLIEAKSSSFTFLLGNPEALDCFSCHCWNFLKLPAISLI